VELFKSDDERSKWASEKLDEGGQLVRDKAAEGEQMAKDKASDAVQKKGEGIAGKAMGKMKMPF